MTNFFTKTLLSIIMTAAMQQAFCQVSTQNEIQWHCGDSPGGRPATADVVAILDTTTFTLIVRRVVAPGAQSYPFKMKAFPIESYWSRYADRIKKIQIETGVKNVSANAFQNCRNLEEVTFPPTGMDSIGEAAFEGCIKLASINLPGTIRFIGDYAFERIRVQSLTIPSSVERIGRFAFAYCESLKRLTFADDILPLTIMNDAFHSDPIDELMLGRNLEGYEVYKSIVNGKIFNSVTISGNGTNLPNNAFRFCRGIKTLVISGGIDNIILGAGSSADSSLAPFYSCIIDTLFLNRNLTFLTSPFANSQLKMVFLGNGVQYLPSNIFGGCKNLTTINIPSSTTSIDNDAFNGCKKISSITVDESNQHFAAVDGILYNKSVTTLRFVPLGKSGIINLPNTLTIIPSGAFFERSQITTINIPASVQSIGSGAFYQCDKLTDINVESANLHYASILGVLYNKNITNLLQYPTFKSGTQFTIPASVTSIDRYAFDENEQLNTIYDLNTQHQTIDSNTFARIRRGVQNMTLYVTTSEAKSDYETANIWRSFMRILVIIPAQSLTITNNSKTFNDTTKLMIVDESFDIDVTITPTSATNRKVGWTSSNPSVAAVDANGKVTALSSGDAIITATTLDGSNKTARFNVVVRQKESGGKSTAVEYNESLILRVYPNPAVEHIIVQLPDEFYSGKHIYIYSITGTLCGIYNVDGIQTSIPVEHLPQGMYVLKSGAMAVKFLKK